MSDMQHCIELSTFNADAHQVTHVKQGDRVKKMCIQHHNHLAFLLRYRSDGVIKTGDCCGGKHSTGIAFDLCVN